MSFYFFITLIIVVRITELIISRRNEKWLRDRGAVEYGKGHYPFMILLHVSFFVSMLAEYLLSGVGVFEPIYFGIVLVLIATKFWIITTLGRYWNTRILRIPNVPLVRSGIYKYIHHPNYVIVVCEIGAIPLVFGLYYTFAVFSLLNLLMLFVRIDVENKALGYS